jgi:hypothetical protein
MYSAFQGTLYEDPTIQRQVRKDSPFYFKKVTLNCKAHPELII